MSPEPLENGRRALAAAAASFRLGMEAQAGEALALFVDWLSARLAQPANAARSAELAPLLGEIVAAQERGDVLGLADLLEYELGPRLPR